MMKKGEGDTYHYHCDWCKLGFAFGIANAFGLLLLGLLGAHWGYGLQMISTIGSIYPGYEPTVGGSFVGAFWGFLDMLIFFLIAGLIYRGLSKYDRCCGLNSSCRTQEVDKKVTNVHVKDVNDRNLNDQ